MLDSSKLTGSKRKGKDHLTKINNNPYHLRLIISFTLYLGWNPFHLLLKEDKGECNVVIWTIIRAKIIKGKTKWRE